MGRGRPSIASFLHSHWLVSERPPFPANEPRSARKTPRGRREAPPRSRAHFLWGPGQEAARSERLGPGRPPAQPRFAFWAPRLSVPVPDCGGHPTNTGTAQSVAFETAECGGPRVPRAAAAEDDLTFSPLGPESPLRPGSPGGPCGGKVRVRFSPHPALHRCRGSWDITHHGAGGAVRAWGSRETLFTLKHSRPSV